MKYGVNRQILLIIAGTVWIIAGGNILRIGIVTWMNNSHDWMFKIGEATIVFLLSFLFLRCKKLDNHDIHDFSRNYDPKLPFATRKFYLCLLHRIIHCADSDRNTFHPLLVAET